MNQHVTQADDKGEVIPHLRFLRILVAALAGVMGIGIIAIVILLWFRLGSAPLPVLPDQIRLPADTRVDAVTFSQNWIVVVTDDGQILLFDQDGTLRDQVAP